MVYVLFPYSGVLIALCKSVIPPRASYYNLPLIQWTTSSYNIIYLQKTLYETL